MGVDVKTLRIGSHILVNGKRVRVRGLDEDNGLIIRFPAEYVNTNDVQPIAITAKLLEELGFEVHRFEHPARNYWTREDGGTVGQIYFSHIISTGEWVGCVYPPDAKRPQFYVRYLHEAETFLALHGVELIPD